MSGKTRARVLRTVRESDTTTSIILDPADDERFSAFRPGQFATLRILDENGWSKPHPFTISGAPGDNLRMTIKGHGEFTARQIPALQEGDEVECAGPFGVFCHDIADKEEIVMIAGGVGITPFLSVLRHFARTAATNNVVLFWCNKTYADAFAAQELEDLTTTLRLHLVHVLSREVNPDMYAEADRPNVHFEKGHFSRDMLAAHIHSTTASFYLCGPSAMQQHVLAELRAYGIDDSAVETEAFASVVADNGQQPRQRE